MLHLIMRLREEGAENMDIKKLQAKVNDFKTYGAITTALATFFYIGTLLPKDGLTQHKIVIIEGIVITMLISSLALFLTSNYFHRKLKNEEQA
ncbi:YrhC family protein [Bacillus sp. EAC]|uniref:YrhC family protein n=1 Tax=Bacillus sp. EAC TaxID=1978338 RepID=UPI000B43493F|nr:YrhC family protein [Bacillus sp. EAC]